MKKTFALILILLLTATVLFGCSRESKSETGEYFCQVMCLQEDGMILMVDMSDRFDHIYVKDLSFLPDVQPLDTVVMEFSPNDLIPTSGSFVDYFGREKTYSGILERPISIRYPTPEEPTYG